MKSRFVLLIKTAAASCFLLAGCGGSNHGGAPPVTMMPPPPPPPTTKDLDTAAVLSIIQTQTSETADPFEVDNGVVAVTPVGDETSAPVSVDAP
jgi:hypothetical protein